MNAAKTKHAKTQRGAPKPSGNGKQGAGDGLIWPHSVEAEEAVAGSLLIDPEEVARVRPILGPDDFFIVKNRLVYKAIVTLHDRSEPIDFVTVTEELEKCGQLADIGGHGFVSHLINVVPTAIHAEGYARIVREKSERREFLQLSSEMGATAYADDYDTQDLIDRTRLTLDALQRDRYSKPLDLLSADSLLMAESPDLVWAIPDLMPVGLTILAGASKIGKSWLGMQIAQAIGAGGVALGERVERGPVLYLALEDSPRRITDRMKRQGWPPGLPVDFMPLGQFESQIGDLRNGGGERLARQIERRGYRLVVIDTLSRSLVAGKKNDQNEVSDMTAALSPLQEMAHTKNCGVLLIDHHRKAGPIMSDVIADILGSTAKGATADTVWGLYRERGKPGARLAVTGREISERTLALKMDWLTGCWQVEGDADAMALTERRQELLDALKELGKSKLKKIADATGQDKGNAYKRLQDLVSAGLIKREGEYYVLL